MKGLDSVAGLEKQADNLVATMASGGNVQISDVMAATSKANLGMSIVNEIRARGLEAYQSIINVQV
jgi:flagellar hook-basal body complex protein FliE